MLELELKAVVPDVPALRQLLGDAGTLEFAGRMRDRYHDRDGELAGRSEVLRLRRHEATGAASREQLTWKGPTHVRHGYKARREVELLLERGGDGAAFLAALGFRPTHGVDRFVEVYRLAGGVARIEWYPRMDTLLEVEGTPEAIEAIAAHTGVPRDAFRADPLATFEAEYRARTGEPAVLALADPDSIPDHWPR